MSVDSSLAGSAIGPGAVAPIQLLAGDGGVLVTDGAPLAANTKLLMYQIVSKNANGELIAYDDTAAAPANVAIGILLQDADSTVATGEPGTYCPYYKEGKFNHEALVWPAGKATLAARQAVFEGTPIHISHVLK